jgi:hypothetical protein
VLLQVLEAQADREDQKILKDLVFRLRQVSRVLLCYLVVLDFQKLPQVQATH